MNGNAQKLIKYMDGASKRFIIPVYQRNYDWKTEQCRQLYSDLVKVIKQGRKSHFFGSIVSVQSETGTMEEFLIIDGQQRLTTISLLLLAIYRLLCEGKAVSQDKQLTDKILKKYLIDEYEPEEKRIKLKPIKNDEKAFNYLFDPTEEKIPGSNLTINYQFFYDRIQKGELTIDELFDAICKLEIINISLNHEDDPQLIFESLNSTGLALSEGDKIRNFILMGLPTKEQEQYYEKYWNKIEECTGYDVSLFVRDYLSVKTGVIAQMNRVYFSFKEYVEKEAIETELLLIDLLKYANYYKTLRLGNTLNEELNGSIYRLNRLETAVTRPFLLEVFRLYSEDKVLDLNQVAEICGIIESYVFRRLICDLPTNALNKIFLALHKEIVRYDKTTDNYLEKFKFAMLSKKERTRFPDDKEFLETFISKPVYLMNSKNKQYLFERLENYGTKEDKSVWSHLDNGDYSIEHIMPQHLTPAWVESLGDGYADIHESWLHRIANLTLTAYNSKYSNNTFLEKRDMTNGFKDSGIRMNQKISQKTSWGLSEMEERSAELQKIAAQIWAMPQTSYVAPEKQMDSFALDDDIEFTGKVIAKFSFKNTEHPVESWIDMYQKVLMLLHSEDKSVLSYLAHTCDETVDLSSQVSSNASDFNKCIEIDNGIYVWSNTSTRYKINALRRFFVLYGKDPSDLILYIKEGSDSDDELNESRFEIRKKYWTYALDLIQEANGDGPFSNVSPSKDNWISGFFGIGGFNIACVANFDSARVELYLGKASKEENKEAFDKLYSHKEEIENVLGVSLLWNRNDDVKASRIYFQLDDVSIGNESDWPKMAEFHAEWSKRFYNLIVLEYLAK